MPSSNITRSVTTFDDITAIDDIVMKNTKIDSHKKSSSATARKFSSPIVATQEDVSSYQSVGDIFNRRLRTLRKRMQKIEKNEEIIQAFQEEKIKLFKHQRSSNDTKQTKCPLDADQLKAIENKPHLNEMIHELEHMNELVSRWLSTTVIKTSNSAIVKTPIAKIESQPTSTYIQPTIKNREIFELWAALSRLENLPKDVLLNEDLLELKSLNSVIQSIIEANDYDLGLNSIISWMESSHVLDNSSELDHSSSLFELCPPYPFVKHCIKKILSTSHSISAQEKVTITTEQDGPQISHDSKPKRTRKEKSKQRKINVDVPSTSVNTVSEGQSLVESISFAIPSVEEKSFMPWAGLPIDSAIIKSTNAIFVSEAPSAEHPVVEGTGAISSSNIKKPAFVLKKIVSPKSTDKEPSTPKHLFSKQRSHNGNKLKPKSSEDKGLHKQNISTRNGALQNQRAD